MSDSLTRQATSWRGATAARGTCVRPHCVRCMPRRADPNVRTSRILLHLWYADHERQVARSVAFVGHSTEYPICAASALDQSSPLCSLGAHIPVGSICSSRFNGYNVQHSAEQPWWDHAGTRFLACAAGTCIERSQRISRKCFISGIATAQGVLFLEGALQEAC
jgi:hypothetical protein